MCNGRGKLADDQARLELGGDIKRLDEARIKGTTQRQKVCGGPRHEAQDAAEGSLWEADEAALGDADGQRGRARWEPAGSLGYALVWAASDASLDSAGRQSKRTRSSLRRGGDEAV